MFIQYIILGFVFAAGIGPSNIETAKRGLLGRPLSATAFYLGNVLIDVFYILVIALGFTLFVENKTLQMILGIFGVTYLLYLGISDIRGFFKKDIFTKKKEENQSVWKSGLEGILVNIANPMAIASWLAFYSVASTDFNSSRLNLVAVIIGVVLIGLTIVLITQIFKKVLGEKILKYISLIAGITLIGFSLLFTYYLFG
ncbi:LysE family transporter [Patescibacteria group bacterium]|nr:LysE family transporter [Patescibacteria group bacterium]